MDDMILERDYEQIEHKGLYIPDCTNLKRDSRLLALKGTFNIVSS